MVNDKLLELIDLRVKQLDKISNNIKSLPCKVIAVNQDESAVVELFSTGARYTAYNYSGSPLNVGENVQMFYNGDISQGNKYIGASINKGDGGVVPAINIVEGDYETGEIFETARTVCTINIECVADTCCTFFFNANLFGSEAGTATFSVYNGETRIGFSYKQSVNTSAYSVVSVTFPIVLSTGRHEITVQAEGVGSLTDINSYVSGFDILHYDSYDDTSDEDYIFEEDTNTSNAVYYIGSSTAPKVPVQLGEKDLKTLRAVSFDNTDIRRIYISEGIETIE